MKLNEVIAYRRVRRLEVKKFVSLRSRALRRMQTFTQIKHELEAAENVVRSPTTAEIEAVQALLTKVKGISVKQAAGQAGLQLIQNGKAILDQLTSSTQGIRGA